MRRFSVELHRLEVDVARAKGERLGDPAPGHREGPGEGLHGGFRVDPDRGEEALALAGGQVLAPARVNEGERPIGHGPESYITS